MRKHIFFIVAVALAASTFVSCNTTPASMQRIEKLVAAGDTVTTNGLHNPILVYGAKITPAMLEANPLIVTVDKVSQSPAPDSELCIVMHHTDSVAVICNKRFLATLFPEAKEFTVDGDKVSREEFYSIPSSLFLNVHADANGTKLDATTRPTADFADASYQTLVQAEEEWWAKNRPTPSKEQLKAEEQMKSALDNIVNQ